VSEPTNTPSHDDPSDRALDDRVRAASEALFALASEAKLDGIAAWVDRELEQIDRRGGSGVATPVATSLPADREHRRESRMMSDSDKTSGRDSVTPPSTKPARTDDSGLHDLKALAQDTRKRISKRITTQIDTIDESLLSASHSGLRAVALPEPALMVSLPDVPATMAQVRAAAAAGVPAPVTASEGAIIAPLARKRTAVWVGLGAVGLAAAAAIVIMSGGKKDPPPAPTVASAAGADQEARVDVAPAMPTGPAPAAEVTGSAPTGSAPTDPAAVPAGAGAGGATVDRAAIVAPVAPPPSTTASADKGRVSDGKREAITDGAAAGSSKKPEASKRDADALAVATGTAAKPGGKAEVKAGAGAKPAASGEKSIEDLLDDASGGPTKPKDTAGDAPAAPDKTGLDTGDIKKGMRGVAGKAQGCFDQHGVAGHVKVRATVASSGAVTKVEATGEFAGTPTGSCVADVVKGAAFPAWSGSPMTINYSFTLQE